MVNCYYCKTNDATENSTWVEHEMYYVSKRIRFPVGIKFHSKKVKIPRCSSCKQIHKKIFLFISLIWLITLSVSFALFFYMTDVNMLTNCILSVLISSLISWFIRLIYDDFLFVPIYKIKPEADVDDYPIVKAMLDEGWSHDRPDPAGASTAEENKRFRKSM